MLSVLATVDFFFFLTNHISVISSHVAKAWYSFEKLHIK